MRVPYRLAREAFVSLSAADVLLRPESLQPALAGAVVLVGSTAFGMADTVATPLGAVASGLEVHVQAMSALLDDAVPYTPAAWPWMQAALLVVIAGLLGFAGSAVLGTPASGSRCSASRWRSSPSAGRSSPCTWGRCGCRG